MNLTGKLKPGMRVVGADETEYGTVEHYDHERVYVDGQPVPYRAFDRLDQDRLYVRQGGERYFSERRQEQAVSREGEVRVPLVEERLTVGIRPIELGDVEIRKTVETEQTSVPIVLRRDQVDVRLVGIDERPIALYEVPDAFKEETIRVPVRGEQASVQKVAVVTGEVAVSRTEVSERQTVSETVRQVTVTVTANYDEARPHFRQHFEQMQARLKETGGPTFRARDFAAAESNYRTGFEARNDPRNANRSFEDVEGELRARYFAGADTGESWESDREQLRTGWEHGRR